MPYPGKSYVLDLPALLPRVSQANIIKFTLTSIFQASLLYSLNPPSAHPGRVLLKSTLASPHTSHSLKNAMLANTPSSLTTQPPTGRSPLVTLSSPVWITSEFVFFFFICDRLVLMLLVSATELSMLSQWIPHASSITRESLRMLHTSCLHALSSKRKGWSCTQRPHPLYTPKSQTRELTHKTSWRWWLARAGLMTPMSKNSAVTFWASSRQPEQASFSQIYPKCGLINSRTTLTRWRQERRNRRRRISVAETLQISWNCETLEIVPSLDKPT